MQSLITLVIYLLICYCAIQAFALFIYPSLLYYPPKTIKTANYQEIILQQEKGQLALSFYANPEAKHTIIVSHGNAEDLNTLHYFLKDMQKQGYQVLAYDYRGYGQSRGSMRASQSLADVLTVYDYATTTLNIPSQSIVAYGRSLGAAHALYLTIHRPVYATVLEAPFTSLHQVMTQIRILFIDPYPNNQWILKNTTPTLIIHGEQDRLIAPTHAKQLSTLCKSCQLTLVPHAGHNDIMRHLGPQNYWNLISKFIQEAH